MMNLLVQERQSLLEMDAKLFGWAPTTVMVMLYGFVDESGEWADGRLQRLTLGGFIAPWSSVKRLCVEWRAALDDESLESFHMREIASDERDFANWPFERQRRLDRFIDILCKYAVRFFAFNYAVTMPDAAFYDTYETALSRVMLNTGKVAVAYGQPVRLVFAKTNEISLEMIGKYFDHINWYEDHVSAVSQESSAKCPPLQAAEIVARGLRATNKIEWPVHSLEKILQTRKDFDYVISG
jgi:hypothetical protein